MKCRWNQKCSHVSLKLLNAKIEGNNFDRRKTVVEYDEVLRKQRDIIYKQRNDILFLDDIDQLY